MDYPGRELESFALAQNWKAYVQRVLDRYLLGDVAEVGAGLGETTKALRPGSRARTWACIEPDPAMAQAIVAAEAKGDLGSNVAVHCATLAGMPEQARFDSIAYIDVLEHIEDDSGELRLAADRLRPGGRIVVLSPAFQWLYSEFDRAIGHYRRYSLKALRAAAPPGMAEEFCRYLDSAGLMASAANRFLLRQSMPSEAQVLTWDRLLVPVSRFVDPLFGYSFGRSVIMVWTKS